MLRDFNLLVSTSRGNEYEASFELRRLFEEIGDSTAVIDKTGVSGLIAVKVTSDPFETILKLRKILLEHPYKFRFVLRVIPVEKVVRTNLDEIKHAAAELSSKIEEGNTFRITVEKRFTPIASHDIIEATASDIKRKVDLEKPDRILLVEVVGGLTGLSVIRPDEILAIMKEKVL